MSYILCPISLDKTKRFQFKWIKNIGKVFQWIIIRENKNFVLQMLIIVCYFFFIFNLKSLTKNLLNYFMWGFLIRECDSPQGNNNIIYLKSFIWPLLHYQGRIYCKTQNPITLLTVPFSPHPHSLLFSKFYLQVIIITR